MRKSKGRKTETKDREDRNGDVDGKNSNDEVGLVNAVQKSLGFDFKRYQLV